MKKTLQDKYNDALDAYFARDKSGVEKLSQVISLTKDEKLDRLMQELIISFHEDKYKGYDTILSFFISAVIGFHGDSLLNTSLYLSKPLKSVFDSLLVDLEKAFEESIFSKEIVDSIIILKASGVKFKNNNNVFKTTLNKMYPNIYTIFSNEKKKQVRRIRESLYKEFLDFIKTKPEDKLYNEFVKSNESVTNMSDPHPVFYSDLEKIKHRQQLTEWDKVRFRSYSSGMKANLNDFYYHLMLKTVRGRYIPIIAHESEINTFYSVPNAICDDVEYSERNGYTIVEHINPLFGDEKSLINFKWEDEINDKHE